MRFAVETHLPRKPATKALLTQTPARWMKTPGQTFIVLQSIYGLPCMASTPSSAAGGKSRRIRQKKRSRPSCTQDPAPFSAGARPSDLQAESSKRPLLRLLVINAAASTTPGYQRKGNASNGSRRPGSHGPAQPTQCGSPHVAGQARPAGWVMLGQSSRPIPPQNTKPRLKSMPSDPGAKRTEC